MYGEFYGIEGDGMEAREMFEPVIFSGMCAALTALSPSDVE